MDALERLIKEIGENLNSRFETVDIAPDGRSLSLDLPLDEAETADILERLASDPDLGAWARDRIRQEAEAALDAAGIDAEAGLPLERLVEMARDVDGYPDGMISLHVGFGDVVERMCMMSGRETASRTGEVMLAVFARDGSQGISFPKIRFRDGMAEYRAMNEGDCIVHLDCVKNPDGEDLEEMADHFRRSMPELAKRPKPAAKPKM